jgi:hypothetical protein
VQPLRAIELAFAAVEVLHHAAHAARIMHFVVPRGRVQRATPAKLIIDPHVVLVTLHLVFVVALGGGRVFTLRVGAVEDRSHFVWK